MPLKAGAEFGEAETRNKWAAANPALLSSNRLRLAHSLLKLKDAQRVNNAAFIRLTAHSNSLYLVQCIEKAQLIEPLNFET